MVLILVVAVILLMAEIWLTTWDVENLVNNGINYLSTGAGIQPSTVSTGSGSFDKNVTVLTLVVSVKPRNDDQQV